MMLVRELFWAFCAVQLSLACPFGGEGPLPEGHPPLEGRRLSTYPGYLVDDYADNGGSLSSSGPGSPSPWPTNPSWNPFLDALVQKSAEMGDADLCYWSWQTLPGPGMREAVPSVSLEDVNLWFENTNGEAANFGDMAVKRMQKHVNADGPVMWTGCSLGSTLRKAMCDNNMSASTVNGGRMEDCALDAVYNQTLMTPTAIVIFRFRSSTVDQLKNILHLWRTDKTGQTSHAPQMMSSLVLEKGWGSGGQIISKTVPCSQIPEKFKYQNLGDCEQMGDNAVLLADEAFQVWSSLCSITKDNCPGGTSTSPEASSTSPEPMAVGAALLFGVFLSAI